MDGLFTHTEITIKNTKKLNNTKRNSNEIFFFFFLRIILMRIKYGNYDKKNTVPLKCHELLYAFFQIYKAYLTR